MKKVYRRAAEQVDQEPQDTQEPEDASADAHSPAARNLHADLRRHLEEAEAEASIGGRGYREGREQGDTEDEGEGTEETPGEDSKQEEP